MACMVPRYIHVAIVAASLALLASPLAANPFLADSAEGPVLPQIRTPTSQGPMVDAQRSLREQAAEGIRLFTDDPSGLSLAALLGAALLYGVLHAAGPGHRKTIVFSLFIGRKAAPWEPLAAGFLAAGIHAGVGMALIGALSLVYGALAGLGDTERLAAYLEASTFGILIALSLVLAAAKVMALASGKIHGHLGTKQRGLYSIIVVSSLVPCPGATMLLLFSLYAGLPWLGAAAVLAMSVGMGLVISAAGYLAYAGRAGLFKRLKAREQEAGLVADGLELVSYLLVLAFSLYMAWPVVAGFADFVH